MKTNFKGNRLALATAGIGIVLAGRKIIQLKKSMNLHGQVVLITGGSRGLGLALAEEFAYQGTKLVICARSEQELQRAQRKLKEQGAEVLSIACDITVPEQVQRMTDQATEHYGRIDILVNNAGIISAGPLQTRTRSDFEDSMNTMFWGIYNTTMAVLPQMLQRKKGTITNITSIGGKVSVPHLLPYSSAKFAAVGFSEGLRAELIGEGIKVVTIAPGLLRTGSHLNAIMQGSKHREEFTAFTLLDTLPFTSISARKAARQIVSATQRGSAEVILSIQAQFLSKFHGLFPSMTIDMLALTNRLLPSSESTGTQSYSGKESETFLTKSILTVLGKRAASTYNENGNSES